MTFRKEKTLIISLISGSLYELQYELREERKLQKFNARDR